LVGSIVRTIKNVELGRARLALASLKNFYKILTLNSLI